MKLLIQRVRYASVEVNNNIIGEIKKGLCIFVGIKNDDDITIAEKMAEKVSKLRIFNDNSGKMNLSLNDVDGEILSISQFTLYSNTTKGNRPSFQESANKDLAFDIYEIFNSALREKNIIVETGKFGADMQVRIDNDGPVTIIVEITN